MNKVITYLLMLFILNSINTQNVEIRGSIEYSTGNDTVAVEIMVDNFNDIRGMQMTLAWDPTQLTFISEGNFGLDGIEQSNFGIPNITDGYITFFWISQSLSGQTLNNGHILFSLYFQVNGVLGTTTPVSFINTPISIAFFDIATEVDFTITSGSVTIISPLVFNLVGLEQISCTSPSGGEIDIEVSGGLPPYSYLWDSGQTTADINNLSEGNYQVSIMDSAGNTITPDPFSIESVSTLGITRISTTFCDNTLNYAVAIVENGNPPYNYQWSNSTNENFISNVPGGIYTVTVTDADTCVVIDQIEIPDVDPMVVNYTANNVSCYGGNDGSITIEVSGGLPPFSYQWYHEEEGQSISNLPSGDYTVNVASIPGSCAKSEYVTILQPAALQLEVLISALRDSAQAIVTGGTEPYHFFWSDGQEGDLATNLQEGNYSVTVVDTNECSDTVFFNIEIVNDLFNPSENYGISFFPNPVNEFLFLSIDADEYKEIPFFIQNALGQVVLKGNIPATAKNYKLSVAHLQNGMYWFSIGRETKKIIKI